MKHVMQGRYTVEMDKSFVVFIIGMRINRYLAVHKWIPVSKAMRAMIIELTQNPETGFLSAELSRNGRILTVVQYWRSYDQLEKYARGELHLKTWDSYNKTISANGAVGIFHETYRVELGDFECVYNNMPKFGLGKAGNHIPVSRNMQTSRSRLGNARGSADSEK
ncbi:DUF4188 domain-containing protein [Paenibacillus glycinis]|uniref:DUF4188 domain-containing protein n=1 Tax=Paenibacillus glycinis TaxID=2697035 RepID=A0ABW9XK89_9BACL|nr:DUF4188 domain-containing protein [Paenibacillus glycinis]NBD23023.1 DUF4188 domain-containing protein [Paenibacillus glycinis]